MGAPNRPRHGEKLVRADWVSRAVALSIKGWSLRKIAKQVGKSHTAVAKALAQEFEDRRPSAEQVELARTTQREQVQSVLKSWLPKAVKGTVTFDEDGQPKAVTVDDKAAAVVLKCWERLAKLDGLDAAQRTELTGKDGAPLEVDVHAILADRLARLAAEAGAGPSNTEPESAGDD